MAYRGVTPDTERTVDPDPSSEQEEQTILSARLIASRLGPLATRIHIVHTALILATEGNTRATVSAITRRVGDDYEQYVLPSVAGRLFSEMGIRRVTSHGQNRLVLDQQQLEGIRQRLMARLEEIEPRVEEAISNFADVSEKVDELEIELARFIAQAKRAKEVRIYLQENRRAVAQSSRLESNYERMKSQLKRNEQMDAACAEMEERLKAGADMARKRAELEQSIERLEEEETDVDVRGRDLARTEQRLERKIRDLSRRQSVVDLVELEETIGEKRKELDGVLRELGEKKSLLSKALGR